MAVTDEQVAALRAYLADDEDEYGRLIERVEEADGLAGFSALFGSAFFDAVNRRFSPDWTVGEVVRFVADVRARYIKDPNQLNPRDAERLIRTALGDGSIDDLDEDIKSAQMILLPALIHAEQPSPAVLEEILARARERADNLPL
jgi:hypothetical protein